jgi:hypothetical protein
VGDTSDTIPVPKMLCPQLQNVDVVVLHQSGHRPDAIATVDIQHRSQLLICDLDAAIVIGEVGQDNQSQTVCADRRRLQGHLDQLDTHPPTPNCPLSISSAEASSSANITSPRFNPTSLYSRDIVSAMPRLSLWLARSS